MKTIPPHNFATNSVGDILVTRAGMPVLIIKNNSYDQIVLHDPIAIALTTVLLAAGADFSLPTSILSGLDLVLEFHIATSNIRVGYVKNQVQPSHRDWLTQRYDLVVVGGKVHVLRHSYDTAMIAAALMLTR